MKVCLDEIGRNLYYINENDFQIQCMGLKNNRKTLNLYEKERSAMTFVFIGATLAIYIGVGKYVMKQATAHLN